MTADTSTVPPVNPTAGALLRQYREAHGFQVDTLAQALRVSPAKLEALEADRLGDLPDAMFARALTLAVSSGTSAVSQYLSVMPIQPPIEGNSIDLSEITSL